MRLRRRNIIKTLVFSRSAIDILKYVSGGIALLFVFFTIVSLIFGKKSFVSFVMDSFLMKNTVYAEVAEIFTDKQGRTNAILGGYTMVIGEKKEEKQEPEPAPSQKETNAIKEPKITESKATTLTEIKNQSGKSVDAEKLVSEKLSYQASGKKANVLIIHTHTTESYFEQDRSIDENKNMIAVGKVIAEKLSTAGIAVTHDTTVHDYPSYNGAYTRAAATTTNRLKENPEINIVLDIHRDAVASEDGSKLSLVTDINGQKTAQLMFVVGTDVQLKHDKWQENMKLALKLQRCAEELYPTLMRPINLREQRFNQQLSEGSIIIEVGTNGNTLDEAKRGASLISDALIRVLSDNN